MEIDNMEADWNILSGLGIIILIYRKNNKDGKAFKKYFNRPHPYQDESKINDVK